MSNYIWTLILIVSLTACSEGINGPGDDNEPNLRVLSPEEQSLAASSNGFVIDLLNELDAQEGNRNLFFSPLSVQYALSMTLNGADGTTYNAIQTAIGMEGMNEQEINEAYSTLTDFLLKLDKKVLLTIANSIWYEEDLSVRESFVKAMLTYYNAEVTGLDFKSVEAVPTINNWVDTSTNGLIDELIEEIPPEAVMYLVNAIYFKADWKNQFDESATSPGPFFLEGGGEVEAEMMHAEEIGIKYHVNETAHVIDIPYGNGQYSMLAFLPVSGKRISDILDIMNENIYHDWVNAIGDTDAELIMPKFKIAYKALLNDALSNMGMEIAFTDQAELPRLFEEPYGLMISKVIHKAVIEVDEQGTEAAAVTGVEVGLTSLPPEKLVLSLNRPFLFFIREKHSGTVLFAGKLSDPSK